MFQREVTDKQNIRWSCVQAYAGLEDKIPDNVNELAETNNGKVEVVCTPSGGAKSVRLELVKNWADHLNDDELVSMIGHAQ